jgi:hypothetical protein
LDFFNLFVATKTKQQRHKTNNIIFARTTNKNLDRVKAKNGIFACNKDVLNKKIIFISCQSDIRDLMHKIK